MNVLKTIVTETTKFYGRSYGAQFARSVTVYKSAISLDNLYPNSTLKLTTPTRPETSMSSKFSGYIPLEQLDITYARSSGPGGQNVNKVNTKVNLSFHVESAKWLDEDIKSKIIDKYKSKLTKDGYMIIRSELTRSQQLNLADCLQKLRSCILGATYETPPPSAETEARIRKRHEMATRERLSQKRERSQTKSDRRAPVTDF